MSTKQLRNWALSLAERGWPVFPLRPGAKTPALHGLEHCPRTGACSNGHLGWEHRATTDSEVIERCWSHDAYNIGLATGPAGLVVIDLDFPKPGYTLPDGWNILGVSSGADVLDYLAQRAGHPLPETYAVRTVSGGRHLFFHAPARIELRNTAGVLGPLIDTRAHGGYVVAPGSLVPPGGYELVDDQEPADLPGWLVQALAPKSAEATSGREKNAVVGAESLPRCRSRYAAAALREEAQRVSQAPSGQQNNTLFGAALTLGRLVAGGSLDPASVRATLHEAMRHVPNTKPQRWTTQDIDRTITSGFRAASNRPRALNGDGRRAA